MVYKLIVFNYHLRILRKYNHIYFSVYLIDTLIFIYLLLLY